MHARKHNRPGRSDSSAQPIDIDRLQASIDALMQDATKCVPHGKIEQTAQSWLARADLGPN